MIEEFDDSMVPGWSSTTGTICLGDNWRGVTAPDGNNYVEIDCQPGRKVVEAIYQDVSTEAGQAYYLSWKMRPQNPKRFDSKDEALNVSQAI